MRGSTAGFTLVELLMAIPISLGIVAAVFMLFHQSERISRDQAVLVEMQQAARVVASQICDDIRMAGQGIPSGMNDVVLVGSNTVRLNVRTGFTATETNATVGTPLSLVIDVPMTVGVESTSGFSAGKQAFLWWEADWARVTINSVSGSARTLRVTPTAASRTPLSFLSFPAVSTDEAVAIYLDATTQTVKRTTATNTSNPAGPAWAPANELATNVTGLTFLYYDVSGAPLPVDTPETRSRVASIEAHITVRASARLSDGAQPSYSLIVRALPRSLRCCRGGL
jgi:Tfp pilus assembly protein PilW